MPTLEEAIDKRIRTLEELRAQYLQEKDIPFANSTWVRLEELSSLKKKYTDKNGDWFI